MAVIGHALTARLQGAILNPLPTMLEPFAGGPIFTTQKTTPDTALAMKPWRLACAACKKLQRNSAMRLRCRGSNPASQR